jgi:hypothetical protein
VDDIDKVVDELIARAVSFEKYEGFGQDGKGIAPGPRAEHRLVQGSSRQHPLRDRATTHLVVPRAAREVMALSNA